MLDDAQESRQRDHGQHPRGVDQHDLHSDDREHLDQGAARAEARNPAGHPGGQGTDDEAAELRPALEQVDGGGQHPDVRKGAQHQQADLASQPEPQAAASAGWAPPPPGPPTTSFR